MNSTSAPVMTEPPAPDQPEATPLPPARSPLEDGLKVWDSAELLGDAVEAIIVHRGQRYRLRCTKQGKLILYK